jgi:hypothetical protein
MDSITIVRTAIGFALGIVLAVNGLSILTWGFWAVLALVAAFILADYA